MLFAHVCQSLLLHWEGLAAGHCMNILYEYIVTWKLDLFPVPRLEGRKTGKNKPATFSYLLFFAICVFPLDYAALTCFYKHRGLQLLSKNAVTCCNVPCLSLKKNKAQVKYEHKYE